MKLKLTILVFVLNNFPRTSFQKRKRMCPILFKVPQDIFFSGSRSRISENTIDSFNACNFDSMIAPLKSALNRCNIGYLLPKKQKLLSIITFYLMSRIPLAHNQIRAGFNNPWLKKRLSSQSRPTSKTEMFYMGLNG